MFRINEGTVDRAVRILVGAVLLYLGLGGVVPGTAGIALSIVAVLPLLTGLVGWCPIYRLLGISTSGGRTGGRATS